MDSKELRKKFIDFFEKKGHQLLPASSLMPENDPSVLFTTAGMQQFKKFYTNPDAAPASKAVTIQPCFRTSDIDEVGDNTHLTFFEMMGNFSFDSYFKKESIEWGYEFLTRELGIEPSRIVASVYSGDGKNPKDEESIQILESMNLKYRLHSREDNFWGPTGEEGPCGPTVEFYVDDIEIWNLVFNEYYKEKDGAYRNLETRGIDTGMGLERLIVVLNDFKNVYETDLFTPLILEIEKISNRKYVCHSERSEESGFCQEFRIIADHIKAAVFAINDGILPSNKDRGYIVRRLIRRAVVKGNQIGIKENFLSDLANKVFEVYKDQYQFNAVIIIDELEKEETKFRNTLKDGLKILNAQSEIDGKILFDLYQSYGLPIEISIEEAKNSKIIIQNEAIEQFNNFLKQHQDLSRTASVGMFKGGLAGGGEKETKLHSATHLLLASLRQVLNSKDIHQRGSNITEERLRFDFSYPDKLTPEQIKAVEDLVNIKIQAHLPISMEEMTQEDAKNCGAIGEFGQKYGDTVKVYSMGNSSTSSEPPFSREICGGPHAQNTGDLGHFKILKEESSSSGVRRIKAILE